MLTNSNIFQKRVNIIMIVCVVAFLMVIIRLFSIQVLYTKAYKELADNQHWRTEDLGAERGVIYSKDLYPLADIRVSYLVFVQPKVIEEPRQVAKEFVRIFDMDELNLKELDKDEKKLQEVLLEERYLERLTLDLYWVIIKSGVSREVKEQVEAMQFKGVGFEEQFVRFYPENTLASHILGFVGKDEYGKPQGYFGVEGFYDGDLRGRAGVKQEERDAQGKLILLGDEKVELAKDGRDLLLTVDRGVQFIAEEAIKAGVTNYDAKNGSVVILEPKTGNVLAIANYPTFTPGDLTEKDCEPEKLDTTDEEILTKDEKIQEECEREERRNLAISDIYEPGSVIKPLTISAALDLGLVTPQTTINDSGPIYASTHKIDNWNFEHHGIITMTRILELSNNIGAAKVGQMVGSKDLYDYFEKFNLNTLTGVDLEGEGSGYLRPLDEWREIDLATASFGQGISATPIQVAGAFAAIANNGVYLKPRVVEKIIDNNTNEEFIIETKEVRRVIKPQTADLMVEMLTTAMKDGIGKNYFTSRYKIAGKTGTAQIPINGEYDPSKTNTTFVAFLPTSRKFLILVKYEEPKNSIYANSNAVLTWFEIADKLVDYYEIEPDF